MRGARLYFIDLLLYWFLFCFKKAVKIGKLWKLAHFCCFSFFIIIDFYCVLDFYWFLLMFNYFYWFLLMFIDVYWCLFIFIDFYWFLLILFICTWAHMCKVDYRCARSICRAHPCRVVWRKKKKKTPIKNKLKKGGGRRK